MSIERFQQLACPLDGEPLTEHNKSWRCAGGHSFDQARQGYVNLLPVQHKRSKEPGDSVAMVEARQRFLQAGCYQPIAERLAHWCLENASIKQALSVLDAGCGEGYYLRQLAQLAQADQPLRLAGLDIAKPAILAAARQRKDIAWLVASNAHLPVQSASLDRVLCIFGFPVASEFARVLKPGGELIQVDPGPAHLQQLRAQLYDRVERDAMPKEPSLQGFQLLQQETLSFPFKLHQPELIQDLLAMTPHAHRAPAEGRERLAQLHELSLTADVVLRRYQPI